MKPNLTRERKRSWGVLAAVFACCALAVAWYHDWGELSQQLATQREQHDSLTGSLELQGLIDAQQGVNQQLRARIEERQRDVGIRARPPFVVPETGRGSADDSGDYFQDLYYAIRESLLNLGQTRGSVESFDTKMGFAFAEGRPPPRDPVERWLTMLQLVTKTCYLACQSKYREITLIEVAPIQAAEGILRGAEGRSPILREYPFSLHVRGTLRDILWLLHQLSYDNRASEQTEASQRFQAWRRGLIEDLSAKTRFKVQANPTELQTAFGPIAVLGLTIDGNAEDLELEQLDNLAQLDVHIDLVGMEFLDQSPSAIGVPSPEQNEPVREQPARERERSRPTSQPSGRRRAGRPM
ncbi:MAG: hypothetical protein ACOCZK_00040 [Planctomycetota bacterium]